MITPDDELLPDDSETADVEQTSQQDVHSIGLDDDAAYEAGEVDETDALNQAYDASESSYTLNLDDAPKDDE